MWRRARRRTVVLLAAVAAIVVSIAAAGPLRGLILEELKLREAASASGAERARALAWLLERGSLRGIALVLEDLIEPSPWRGPSEKVRSVLRARNRDNASAADLSRYEGEFTGLDEVTLAFLENPWLKPAVPSDATTPMHGYEDELERVLEEGKPGLRAQALGILFRVKSPCSVAAQWRAIAELRQSCPALERPLSTMAKAFEPGEVVPVLEGKLPSQWILRAAGVAGHREALPRLGELSCSMYREWAMAALRSIEDFHGPAAEKELGRCLIGWGNDVYRRAGEVLFARNKDYLRELLLWAEAPPGCRHWQGLFLARLGCPEAVPLLASGVHRIDVPDPESFGHLERLAEPEHRDIIEALPGTVRPDQVARARQVVERFRKRWPRR